MSIFGANNLISGNIFRNFFFFLFFSVFHIFRKENENENENDETLMHAKKPTIFKM